MEVARNPYMGPRVRGIKASLIPMDTLRNMVFAQSIDDFAALLSQTWYRRIADRVTRDTTPEAFSEAVLGLVIGYLKGLSATMPPEVKDYLLTYLMRHELDNIKVLVRLMVSGQYSRDRAERGVRWFIEDALARRHVLIDLLSANNIDELLGRLAAQRHMAYGYVANAVDLARKFPGYEETVYETLIDRVWVDEMTKLSGKMGEVAGFMVDFYNINVVLRGKLWGMPSQLVSELAIHEGIGMDLVKMYPEEPSRILSYLSGNPIMAPIVSSGFSEFGDIVRYLHISYYTALRRFAWSTFVMNTEFSPASALAMVHLKDLEADVLASIFNVVWSNLPREVRTRLYLTLIG